MERQEPRPPLSLYFLGGQHIFLFSIVSPVYRAEKIIPELYSRICKALEEITENFEIILVNDCSPDHCWVEIQKLAQKDNRVKAIHLSRNFGQHHAITAGLDYTSGEWIIVMDCDLQDQPEEIPRMYRKAQEGYDVVLGRRINRKDTFFKRLSSFAFSKIYSFMTGISIDSAVGNFGVYHRNVILNFRKMKEKNRSFPLFIKWLGFNTAYVDIEHACRYEGKSSYNLKRLLHFAIDSIIAFSNKPLYLSIIVGFIICAASFLFGLYFFIRYFITKTSVEGWTSLMVSLWFIGGMIMANFGILGLYMGKIFSETKNRPLYVIKELIGMKEISQ